MTMDLAEQEGEALPARMAPARTRFLLNDRLVAVEEPPGTLVLDFLRRRPDLVGTKEGCKEGDCGACVVLVGELCTDAGLRYRPVTSCLMPVDELHGKHLVTIEGLDIGYLNPVQKRVVEHGASQCGFCTPGIVVSLTSMALDAGLASVSGGDGEADPLFVTSGASREMAQVERALSGHLCRCTGYRSLRQAGLDVLNDARNGIGGGPPTLNHWVERGWLPPFFTTAAERLAELRVELEAASTSQQDSTVPDSRILAGGTDLYVQRGDDLPGSKIRVLGRERGLRSVRTVGDQLEIGAQVSFEQLAESADFRRLVPDIARFMHWIASLQVRNRATIGGNLVNASPIGDVTVLMLALGASVRCRRFSNGADHERELPLHRLYRGYKDLDLAAGELVSHVLVDLPRSERVKVDFQKVSKRKCLDIATVNSACRIEIREGRIAQLGLAVGGVAPIPLLLDQVSVAAVGQELGDSCLRGILRDTQEAISPIDDVRGSADYKRALCRRLQIAHFLDLFPDIFEPSAWLAPIDPGVDP